MIVRFSLPEDFTMIDVQPMQALRALDMSKEIGAAVLKRSQAITILTDYGACAAMAGVIEKDADTAFVWVILSGWAGRHMLTITKILKEAMLVNTRNYKFIETVVHSNFLPGHRWARTFGFEKVCVGFCFDPDGRMEDLYRRAV